MPAKQLFLACGGNLYAWDWVLHLRVDQCSWKAWGPCNYRNALIKGPIKATCFLSAHLQLLLHTHAHVYITWVTLHATTSPTPGAWYSWQKWEHHLSLLETRWAPWSGGKPFMGVDSSWCQELYHCRQNLLPQASPCQSSWHTVSIPEFLAVWMDMSWTSWLEPLVLLCLVTSPHHVGCRDAAGYHQTVCDCKTLVGERACCESSWWWIVPHFALLEVKALWQHTSCPDWDSSCIHPATLWCALAPWILLFWCDIDWWTPGGLCTCIFLRFTWNTSFFLYEGKLVSSLIKFIDRHASVLQKILSRSLSGAAMLLLLLCLFGGSAGNHASVYL